MGLSEEGLRKELPYFVTDPSNKAKMEALLGPTNEGVVSQENTKRL